MLIDKPLAIHIGSAEISGEFTITDNVLIVELAHIEACTCICMTIDNKRVAWDSKVVSKNDRFKYSLMS